MSKAATISADEKEWRRRVSFDFGDGGLQPPEGFKDLSIGDEVRVLVTGKVKNLSQNEETSSFSLQMEKIELERQTGKKGGISEALGKAKKKL
jgi:hypothetical protein